MKKAKRVTLTLEVETTETQKDLKKLVKHLLTDQSIKVIQIQVNTIE